MEISLALSNGLYLGFFEFKVKILPGIRGVSAIVVISNVRLSFLIVLSSPNGVINP